MLILFQTHKNTIENFLWRFLQIFGKQGITFLIFITCANVLTPYEFGIYNYILAIVLLLIIFCDFGISTSASRYVTEYNEISSEKSNQVFYNSLLIIVVVAFLISGLVLIFGHYYLDSNFVYILLTLPLLFFIPITSLYDGIFRGQRKFKLLTVLTLASSFLSLPVTLLLILNYTLFGAFLAQLFFYVILCIFLSFGRLNNKCTFNLSVIKDVGIYSFIYGIAIIGNFLFIKFGILILGHYNYIEEIATYELISRFFMILIIPFTLLGQVVAPNFTVLSVRNENKTIYLKSIKYTSFFILMSLVITFLLYFALPPLFKLFFEEYYIKSYFYYTFLVCLILYATNVTAATVDAGIVIPSGNALLMAKVYTIGGIIGVLAALFAVNFFGYFGVIATFAISNVIFVFILRLLFLMKISRQNSK